MGKWTPRPKGRYPPVQKVLLRGVGVWELVAGRRGHSGREARERGRHVPV